jgi:chitinase
LVSPPLVVSTDNAFVLTFKQRYSFENDLISATATTPTAFDGGVIEISLDGAATWQDISTYVSPGYTKTLYTITTDPEADPADGPDTNILAGRRAYGGESKSYPAYQNVSLNLGTALAGQTVQVRFRIGSDESQGAPGWDIDDISFGSGSTSGISNLPFPSIRDDAGMCPAP